MTDDCEIINNTEEVEEQNDLEIIPNESQEIKPEQKYNSQTVKVKSQNRQNYSYYESKDCTQKRRNYAISNRLHKRISSTPETTLTRTEKKTFNVIERPTSIKNVKKTFKTYVSPEQPKYTKKLIKRTFIKSGNLQKKYCKRCRESINREAQDLRASKKKTYTTSSTNKIRGSKVNVSTTVHEDGERVIETKTISTVKDPQSFSRHNYSFYESVTLKPKVERKVIVKQKPQIKPKPVVRGSNYMFYDCNTGYVSEKRNERYIDKLRK